MNRQGLRIHRFLPVSHANGPGPRAVLWVQGCSLRCPGCFNPETHATGGGRWVSVDALLRRIKSLGAAIEGLTVSGGEPLEQLAPLTVLLRRLRRRTDYSVVLLTGYEWSEIQAMPSAAELLGCVDVVAAGRYRPSASGVSGWAQKPLCFLTRRYTEADFASLPTAEVILGRRGEVILSGVDPLRWELRVAEQGCRHGL
ncbi:MAG: radical SAM protein [Thermoguttaceae bacterium]|jgi:anaerobic ribonucleoside-triphosphate reductase activating protein|nr:radical SAM protein [Thermoguttaceae bacterium]